MSYSPSSSTTHSNIMSQSEEPSIDPALLSLTTGPGYSRGSAASYPLRGERRQVEMVHSPTIANTSTEWAEPAEGCSPEARVSLYNDYIGRRMVEATHAALDGLTLDKQKDNPNLSFFLLKAIEAHKKELASVMSNRTKWNELLGHPPDQHPESFCISAEATPGKVQYCPGSVTIWIKALPTKGHEEVCHGRSSPTVTPRLISQDSRLANSNCMLATAQLPYDRNTEQYTSIVSVTPGSALCLTADLQEFWSSRPGIGPPTYPSVGHGEEIGVYDH
jgi:hypothetical protein